MDLNDKGFTELKPNLDITEYIEEVPKIVKQIAQLQLSMECKIILEHVKYCVDAYVELSDMGPFGAMYYNRLYDLLIT
jgi:hypothetical protein